MDRDAPTLASTATRRAGVADRAAARSGAPGATWWLPCSCCWWRCRPRAHSVRWGCGRSLRGAGRRATRSPHVHLHGQRALHAAAGPRPHGAAVGACAVAGGSRHRCAGVPRRGGAAGARGRPSGRVRPGGAPAPPAPGRHTRRAAGRAPGRQARDAAAVPRARPGSLRVPDALGVSTRRGDAEGIDGRTRRSSGTRSTRRGRALEGSGGRESTGRAGWLVLGLDPEWLMGYDAVSVILGTTEAQALPRGTLGQRRRRSQGGSAAARAGSRRVAVALTRADGAGDVVRDAPRAAAARIPIAGGERLGRVLAHPEGGSRACP